MSNTRLVPKLELTANHEQPQFPGAGKSVYEGLEQIRRRLLDITSRNRLIHFKHSSSTLRIVGIDLQETFKLLADSKSLPFLPVPQPRGENLSRTGEKPTAKEVAERLDLPVNFDLIPNSGRAGDLPVLHFEEDFESIIRRIASKARTAIEESGANLLHLVFGFLEWRESDDSTQVRHAPLLVLPVHIVFPKIGQRERDIRVEYTGEDLTTNLSLVEKMKRDFGLDVPQLEENDTPEEYFAKFQQILERKRDWRILRQVSLALLSFGKLLMYLDLDAERWPDPNGLTLHPRLTDLFSAREGTPIGFATEYQIDEEEEERGVPPLVCDADSSQHSALIDADRGANIVIEGPPGTGKSQTITNLIAGFLGNGKRVLFVAEKMAALDVVKRRLDKYGLGQFCLELHSHKTSKVALLKSLDERIQTSRSFGSPHALREKQSLLQQRCQELSGYVSLLNGSYGKMMLSPFELIWRREQVQYRLPEGFSVPSTVTFSDAASWDLTAIEARKQTLSKYQAHVRRFIEAGGWMEPKSNPWHWLPARELDLSERDRLVYAIRKLRDCREEQLGVCQRFDRVFEDFRPDAPLQWLNSRSAWATQLGGVIPEHLQSLLQTLSDTANMTAAHRFLEELEEYKQILSGLPGERLLLEPGLRSHIHLLLDGLAKQQLSQFKLVDLKQIAEAWGFTQQRLNEAGKVADRLAEAFGVSLSFTVTCINHLLTANQLAIAAPLHLAGMRSPLFETDGLNRTISIAAEESDKISSLKSSLDSTFLLDETASPEKLERSASCLETTSWLGRLFSRDFKAAKVLYRRHCRSTSKSDPHQMAFSLRKIAGLKRKESDFAGRADLKASLGEHFEGTKTRWNDLLGLASWYEQVLVALPEHRSSAQELRNALFSLSGTRLKSIAGSNGDDGGKESLQRLVSDLNSLHKLLPHLPFDAMDIEVNSFLASCAAIARPAGELLGLVSQLSLEPDTTGVVLRAFLVDAARLHQLQVNISQNQAAVTILGDHFAACDTDRDELLTAMNLVRAVQKSEMPHGLQRWLLCPRYLERQSWLVSWLSEFELNDRSLTEVQASVAEIARANLRLNAVNSCDDIERSIKVLDKCVASVGLLPLWLDLKAAQLKLEDVGLSHLPGLVSDRKSAEYLQPVFEFQVYDSLIRLFLNENPALWNHSGIEREEVRRQFANLDKEVIELNRRQIAHKASQVDVPAGTHGRSPADLSGLALIQHEIQKQKRHIAIRKLMSRAGNAVQALKPCFMMSPMSVAQFLAPGIVHFDLIVMDEASQLRPEDALGAIARGTQLVIVGDPKQLPPTSFFQRTLDEEEEEDEERTTVADSESILDIAMNCYQPVRRLRWHYRSAHHSLIAFSNQEFYDRDLIVFPSAYHTHDELGVKYVAVNGVYENRRNPLEAERVVEAVLEHIALYPNETLGVVTMNFEQRELMEELLDQRLKSDPMSKDWIERRENTQEPFFIKNLENVQGDERDVIFISVTYGPDARGNLYQRFAGVNSASGHRRLNVLISRARRRTVAFSSIDSDQIVITASTPWGVKSLKGYLHFAKTGVLSLPNEVSGGEPDNEHEAAIGSFLKAHGYEVVPQVGVSGYFIDIGVRHPRKPGAFLLGVEFDGKSYHSGRSARDRDRLRQNTLQDQGWNIHRIWSTDWFKSREAEGERLLRRVRSLDAEA